MAVQRDEETGEVLIQVKVLNDAGQQEGQAMMLTLSSIDILVGSLPEGWKTEEV